jgi:hypothetical protein
MIMRLTDRPRTLAEVRPDIAWPAELQRTLDKALEREASARYQSAAQFGREFNAAIAAMPATRAAEAGTLVMGAAGASPAAQVPPTRVGGAGGATVPMGAVAAPAADGAAAAPRRAAPVATRKSPLPMVLGGVGVVAAAVVLYMSGVLGGGAADGTAAGDATPAAGNEVPVVGSDSSTVSGGAQRPDGRVADGGGVEPAPPPTPLSREMDPDPRATRGGAGNAGTAAAAPRGPDIAQVVATWRGRLMDPPLEDEASTRLGYDALREVEPLLARASGAQLDEVRFVTLLGHAATNNAAKTCEFGRLVRDSRLGEAEKSIAAGLMAPLDCRP